MNAALSEEARYFLFLIEQYALHRGITGAQALELFEKHGITQYIHQMYYTFHTERVENAIDRIERAIGAGAAGAPPEPGV